VPALSGRARRRRRRRYRRAPCSTPSPCSPSKSRSPCRPTRGPCRRTDVLRRSHVERARHRVELARRCYLTVDPDNRLVAGQPRSDWNDALRQLQNAQDDYERAAASATALSDEHKTRIRALAADFPALWSDPATPQRAQAHDTHAHRRRHSHQDRPDPPARPLPRGQTTTLVTPIRPTAWKTPRPTPRSGPARPAPRGSHRRRGRHALNAAGHRSGEGKAFTGRIVLGLRRDSGLASHAERLQGAGLLSLGGSPNALAYTFPPSRPARGPRRPGGPRRRCVHRRPAVLQERVARGVRRHRPEPDYRSSKLNTSRVVMRRFIRGEREPAAMSVRNTEGPTVRAGPGPPGVQQPLRGPQPGPARRS
jgi:hypothetical protein